MILATVPLLLVSTNRSTDSPSFVLPNGTFTTPALALGLSRLRMESLPLTRASPVLLSYGARASSSVRVSRGGRPGGLPPRTYPESLSPGQEEIDDQAPRRVRGARAAVPQDFRR